MSLSQLQAVVALLIRLPERHRGPELVGFLGRFDLDERERAQAVLLAADSNVVKYGRSMANTRRDAIFGQLRTSREFITEEGLFFIWQCLFEPKATHLQYKQLGPAFVDFMLEDVEAGAVLSTVGASFIFDLLRFERTQMCFRPGMSWPEHSEFSPLQHSQFMVVDFEHDIPDFLNRRAEKAAKTIAETIKDEVPDPRAVKILFLQSNLPGSCRYFEIDSSIQTYLQSPTDSPLPLFYKDLVTIGLGREELL